jgi:hypothetical protein
MELRNYSRLLLFAFAIMCFASSCVKEGPQGLAGTNGTNGVDGATGTATCLDCHAGTSMDQKKAEFYLSEHRLGAVAVESEGGASGCSRCHSSEGFIEYATLSLNPGTINKPSAWECSTCHGLHTTFEAKDYALRLNSAPVKSNISATYMFDFKNNSNLCVNCHQSRTAEPNIAKPGATFTVSTRIGPHHGPQGNIVAGVGFAEIPGAIAYPAAGSAKHFAGACTSCHMAPFTNSQGGHSLIPSLAACNTCHNATDKNYDHNGVQTEIAADLVILRDLLVGKGIVKATPDPTNPALITYSAVSGAVPMVQAQAAYNYFGLMDDRSEGVHNPPYVRALVLNSIAALK